MIFWENPFLKFWQKFWDKISMLMFSAKSLHGMFFDMKLQKRKGLKLTHNFFGKNLALRFLNKKWPKGIQ